MTETWPQPAPLDGGNPTCSPDCCVSRWIGGHWLSLISIDDQTTCVADSQHCHRCGRWLGAVDGQPVVGPRGWTPELEADGE